MIVMKQLGRGLSVLLIGLALTACGGTGYMQYQPLPASTTPAERQAYLVSQVDDILDTQDATKWGMSVIIKKNGGVVYSRSKGMADIHLHTTVTADTAFEIASLSKPITAIAVMQLMERRLLSLNDSVLKWLPQLPQSWHGITIHHLLSHQSGIPDYVHGTEIKLLGTLNGLDNQGLLRRFVQNDTLLFAPAAKADYSSSNYVILAEIIALASGMPYAQYLQENIFSPLGMRSTFVYGNPSPTGVSVALNFATDPKLYARFETETNGITLATVGAIGTYSSTADLSALVSGLLAGKLVTVETLRLMTSPQSGTKLFNNREQYGDFYGYGWLVMQQGNGLDIFSHSGREDGFRSYLKINYPSGVDYVILGNGGDESGNIYNAIYSAVKNAYE